MLSFANVNHKKTIEEKVLLQNNAAGGPRKEIESFKLGKMVERDKKWSYMGVLLMKLRLSTLTVKIPHKEKIDMQAMNNFKTINRF